MPNAHISQSALPYPTPNSDESLDQAHFEQIKLAPRFEFGQVVSTPAAAEKVVASGSDWLLLLERHGRGDWGDLEADDKAANNAALIDGGRLFSAYNLPGGGRVWLITEADRSATTFLLPEEY